jgi:hypothetical protein
MDYRALIFKKISPWIASWAAATSGFYHHTQEKVNHLRELDEKYARLAVQNASLKEEFEALKFAKESKSAADETRAFAKRLSQDTGVRTGRSIASFNYKIPTDLSAAQLYTLGMSYFLAHDDEKAAVILSSLISLDGNYRTAKNYMISGVIWYRLENMAQSDQNLDLAIKLDTTPENERYQVQAHLWKALVAKRLQSDDRVQFWLKQLLDHHPHSTETGWVNLGGEEP